MITIADYFMGRDQIYSAELTDELRTNAAETVKRANALLVAFGEDRQITSGWRPKEINQATPGAAPFSRHMTCEAVDLYDPEGDLDEWLYSTQARLITLELWMEHPASTKGWCHVQIVPPKSNKLVFYP